MKRPSNSAHILEYMNFDCLFHNEILFYKKFSRLYKCCPEFIDITPKDNSPIIIIENLRCKNYHLNTIKVNVEDEIVLAAICELAKFHAKGYIQKYREPEKFFQIVKQLKTFDQAHTEKSKILINFTLTRIFTYLRKEKYDSKFCDKLENYLENSYSVMIELCKPVEPLATLNHGDFTINNILYRREEDKLKIKLIDFSMISYCSPFFDFSVFLLLNGSREQWTKKFTTIFNAYCEKLLEILEENEIENLEMFSKEHLYEEYKRIAIIGFITCCFFRPCLMGCFGGNTDHLQEKSLEDNSKTFATIGGDEVTKTLIEMLFDLKEIGCLDHIINN